MKVKQKRQKEKEEFLKVCCECDIEPFIENILDKEKKEYLESTQLYFKSTDFPLAGK